MAVGRRPGSSARAGAGESEAKEASAPMSTQRVLGGMEETSEDTFGGILASVGTA